MDNKGDLQQANINLYGKKLETFFLKSGAIEDYLLFPSLLHIVHVILASARI